MGTLAVKTVVEFITIPYVDLEITATLANGIVLKVTMKAPTEFVFDACITLDEKWNFNVAMLVNEKPLIFEYKFEGNEMILSLAYKEESTAIAFKYDFVPLNIPLVYSWKNYLLHKKMDPSFGRYIATLAFRSTTLGDIVANLNHEILELTHFKTEMQIQDLKMINEYKVEDDIINTFTIQHSSLEQDVIVTAFMHTEDELVNFKISAASSKLDTVMKITVLDSKCEVLINYDAEKEIKLIFAVEESNTSVFMIVHTLETETHEDMTVKLFSDGEIVTFNAYVTPGLIEFVKDMDLTAIWDETYAELCKELIARYTIISETIIEPVLAALQPYIDILTVNVQQIINDLMTEFSVEKFFLQI